MSEQKKDGIVQEQARSKPKIEQIIPEYLDGETRRSLEELAAFCRANGIKCPWSATNRWALKYNKQTVGMIYIGARPCLGGGKSYEKNTWFTTIYMVEEVIRREDLAEVIYHNILPCVQGQKSCGKPKIVTVLGRDFQDVCTAAGSIYENPDAEALDCIKKILVYRVTAAKQG